MGWVSLSIHSANLTVVASPTPPAYTVDVKFNPPATYDPEDASFPVWMRLEDTAQQDPDDEVTLFSYIHMMSAKLTLSPTPLTGEDRFGVRGQNAHCDPLSHHAG